MDNMKRFAVFGLVFLTATMIAGCSMIPKPDIFLPDLVPHKIEGPNQIVTGSVVTQGLHLEVINQGEGAAKAMDGTISVGLYLSKDQKHDGGDLFLLKSSYQISTPVDIASSVQVQMNPDVVIPAEIPSGTYYLLLDVDIDHEVDEKDEKNNLVTQPIYISHES